MNKQEFIDLVASKTSLSKKDAGLAVNAFCDVVKEQLAQGEKISLVGFGTFEVSETRERVGRNPRTGETTTIPARKNPKLKFGKAVKDAVNQ